MTEIYGNGKRFSNTFRFIDDFKVSNGDRLDLDMKIKYKKVSISLYDKRDKFLFYIVRKSYLCSNIPLKVFYLALGTKILRIIRTTNKCHEFRTCSC